MNKFESLRFERFKYLDRRFFPYLEKVLLKIPEDIALRGVLDDSSFDIISHSIKESAGFYLRSLNHISTLVFLNEDILKKPEFQIIHTIAHEIAHKIADKGETGLYEKEAEELLDKWGFHEEVQKVDYIRPVMESGGYELGYQWAQKQQDLSVFESFYDEWNEDRLSRERFEELYYEVDPMSIQADMGCLEEKELTEEEKIKAFLNAMAGGGDSHDLGIIYGIMGYIKGKKEMGRSQCTMEESKKEALIIEHLERAYHAGERIWDNDILSSTWKLQVKYPQIKQFSDALVEIRTLLDELTKGGERDYGNH